MRDIRVAGEVFENALDDVLLCDAGDDFERAAAAAADVDLDAKDPLEPLRLGSRSVSLRGVRR
jgi:hypothetical protein